MATDRPKVTYLYPVAVTCVQGAEVLKELKNKVQAYFQSKSQSGGGDCEIRESDCTRGYILIHFKEQEARQRVLQKSSCQLTIKGRTLDLHIFPLDEFEQKMGNLVFSQTDAGGDEAAGSMDGADHQQNNNGKRENSSDPDSSADDPKKHKEDFSGAREGGNNSRDVTTSDMKVGNTPRLWSKNEDNKRPDESVTARNSIRHQSSTERSEENCPSIHPEREQDIGETQNQIGHRSTIDENEVTSHSLRLKTECKDNTTPDEYSGPMSPTEPQSTKEPQDIRPSVPPEIFPEVTTKLEKGKFSDKILEKIKAEFPSLLMDQKDFVTITGTFTEISAVHQYLQRSVESVSEHPSDTLSEGAPADDQADSVCFPSALYEYIMEVYKDEMEKIEKRYKVKTNHQSSMEGSTYVRFIAQQPHSSPEKAKESFIDKVQKVTGDWNQEKVDPSTSPLTFSDIKRLVTPRWSKILVIQDGSRDIILRGPRDELFQAMKVLQKGDHKLARPRRVVTISSDMSTEIPVDERHMDILKKLKQKEISAIEQKYNVKMEECQKNGHVLITFRAVNAPPDLSPHASHSFITLLQKTFYNIEKKVISVEPDIQEERVSVVQEQLMMGGIDIVMEYANSSVLLIGHPVHVAFAVEKLNGSQDQGQAASAAGEPMDTSESSSNAQKEEEADTCSICLCEIEDKQILKCKHAFCKGCAQRALAHKPVCPICGAVLGVVRGNQPEGTMRDHRSSSSLPGYYGCGTITIHYYFPGGTQQENHPHPGRYFSGTSRTAYLPDNPEGRDVLRLLKKAFDQRLTFTVGDSRTSGATDTVTWNDIHHKTSMSGGTQSFGYPDPDYLKRVRDELKAKGIE